MNLKARFWLLSLALVSMLIMAGCGNTGGGGNTAGGGGGAEAANLSVTGQDALKFEPATLTAKAGQQVNVEFKNAGALQHNWVLVKGGDDVAAQVATAGTAAGPAKGYIPDDANIIKAGALLDGGKNETIAFTAPAAGAYTYICTFPGHYPSMKGTLTVSS